MPGDDTLTPEARALGLAPFTVPDGVRRIAIVGNAPEAGNHAPAIDAADMVLRFNNASGFGGRTGRCVTHLLLVNHGGQMREWLDDPGFAARPVVAAAQSFLFPFQPVPEAELAGRAEGDWTREAVPRLRRETGRPLWVLPAGAEDAACEDLRAVGGLENRPIPSSGYLAVWAVARSVRGRAVAVDLYGFGFEGWNGHSWDAERRWFDGFAERDGVRLHALAG